ncbi:GGDEF domain-containing protein [Pseudomonas sp. CDFA 602]|uniref:sensor domain-containing diguanylate cyclase n=1 Tax=Pseudomonas californiensis TaxID=2829823 RepID=UPI001E2F70FA|nr:sensor domain-containing diguanylate cyclase [Pseudomonas californiensis]MCD5994277.1 GGDEF domain-containing protein [Pseudomonas californiensis]MCD6000015.1 GGDEF domain-containing protein [Pseudomonas californiensis]
MTVDLQALYPKLIQLMLDTVFVVDQNDHIVFVSDACEALLGYRPDEMKGTPITRYMHPEDLMATRASITRVMNGKPHVDFRNRYIRKDGGVVYILWAAFWSEDLGARIGVARNVTALAQAEEELRSLAHYDPLTKLANRSLFSDRLKSALLSAQLDNTGLALLFLDIDNFKGINDVHGHQTGDRILCMVARRLESCMRETDTVARMGGDEFTVLLTGIQSREAITRKLEQIHQAMAAPLPFEFGALKMPLCSIGVAFYPEDGTDPDALLTHSDDAMYRMKRHRSSNNKEQKA